MRVPASESAVFKIVRLLALPLAAGVLLPGCFWGEIDGGARFTVSAGNVDQYVDLLYPIEKQSLWQDVFADRALVCEPDDDDCDPDDRVRSDLVDLFLRYDTTRVRGLMTQKGDLQLTAHLDVGEAYKALVDDSFGDWDYMTRSDRVYGVSGDGCDPGVDTEDRTGVGLCVFDEINSNATEYQRLSEDIRLVILLNLPGEDDVRSVECQDAPRTFESSDWDLPRTLLVNYDAVGPVEDGDETRYGNPDDEEDPPLAQCEYEVFSRLNVATQVFGGDYYGEGEDNADLTIEEARDETNEPLVGTVILEELSLPGEDGPARAKGRYHLAFTAQRFSQADGQVVFEGSFDTEIRNDPVSVENPDRDIDLDPGEGDDL
ncbi:MAG: hypothetical protein KDA24_10185 [Deltaproteobacteria bacterium]|nr:hypothetical protein [Deltaproteobacteria bacterium]